MNLYIIITLICFLENVSCSVIDQDLERKISIVTTFPSPSKSHATNKQLSDVSIKKERFKFENITDLSTRNSILPFLEIPKGDDMRIQELRLDEEYLIFGAFSKLMGFLQPTGFPSDLLRDVVNNRIPFYSLILQVLKMDITVVVWVIIWAIVSLCFPIGLAAQLCCPDDIQRYNDNNSIGPFRSAQKFTERLFGYLLHFFLLFLIPPIILILASNEQMSRSISRSPMAANIIYEDLNAFLRNTHMQITFVVSSSTDIAMESVKEDLGAVDELLGQPLQQDLGLETGIDLALTQLDELKLCSSQVTSMVSDMLTDCNAANMAGMLLEEKLDEVSRELTTVKQQCNSKDRTLCFTLQYSGYEVFSFKNLTNDPKIRHLDTLARDRSFNGSIEAARQTFASIPDQISLETTSFITEARAILNRKRTDVYKSTHGLDVLTSSLSEALRVNEESTEKVVQELVNWHFWMWLCVLAVAALLAIVWSILLCGAPCGCGITSKTITLLLTGTIFSSLLCIFLWGLGSATGIIGGHGQTFICNPLYDSNFKALGELFNAGGILDEKGIFTRFGDANDSIRIENVLKQCQRYTPVYQTFHLNKTINIETVTNYKQWDDLAVLFSNFTNTDFSLEILSPSLQLNLQGLSSASSINMTTYRLESAIPAVKRDLNSFAEQLNTVARQLNEASTARKMDNLAFSVRKIIQNELRQMQEIKHSITYKITALEVLLPPLNKRVNQSLESLKNVQFNLDNKGFQVAKTVRLRFINRITSYLEDLSNYVANKVSKEIGKCRPLWEIFHSTRFYVCKLIVDPVNAIAFSCFLSISLFVGLAPVVLRLINFYKQYDNEISSISSRNGLLDVESAWASPSSETPPEIQLSETVPPVTYQRPTTSTWATPTSPRSESPIRIPPPPRIPDISTISASRSPKKQITSGPRSPRRGRKNKESLRVVEPIRWKIGSTTPKSWI